MATLPRAVQAQLEQAEALLAGNTPPADNAQAATDPAPEAAQQNEPPVQATAPAPEPAPTTPSAEETWERRYKTLQGLFNAEVPKLQQQNKELSAKLHDAIERMEKLSQQPQKPEPQHKPALDPNDVENFGSDLVEMVQRQTQHVLSSVAGKLDGVVANFEARLTQVEQALKGTTQTVAVTAEEIFFNKLAAIVPDWEKVNSSEAFLAWLGDVDPVYGQTRQAALTAAQQNMDVARVAAVFNAFKSTLPKSNQAQESLAKQVSPKATASAPPAPTEKPVITQAQIQAFYKDVATGKYRGRDAEAASLEALINEAIADGRVR